jgi:hypothetical protein
MRLQLLWVFYPAYLRKFYAANPDIAALPYAEQRDALLDDYFGWPPAVARRLAQRGHAVDIIIANAAPLQQAFARENNVAWSMHDYALAIPRVQVQRFQPDVLWTGSNFQYFGAYLRDLKRHCRAVIAWTAAPLPLTLDLGGIDCMLTSHANFAATFRSRGLRCEEILPCFEPRILDRLGALSRDVSVSFLGGLTWAHRERIAMVDALVRHTSLAVWSAKPQIFSRSAARPAFWRALWQARHVLARTQPELYGMDLYRMLARSQLSLNVHAEVAGGLAGNMRLFEITGAGALLLTEQMPNLAGFLNPGTELVTYQGRDDLIDKVRHYLAHPAEAAAIAAAGQRRTLSMHSTLQRAEVLEGLFCEVGRVT